MYNLLKGVLATIAVVVFPAVLVATSLQTSSFQDFEQKEVSNIIIIQENSLMGCSGVLMGIERELWEMARKYKLDYDRFLGLAMCESTLDPNAEGKAGEIGIYQFLPSTFSNYCDGDIFNPNNQIECAAKMISEGLEYHWTCKY